MEWQDFGVDRKREEKMNETKIKDPGKIFQILNLDFKDVKDKLNYEIDIDNLNNLSSFQKWLLYDKYAKRDADIVLKSNNSVLKVLGWDGTYLDAIFPVRQILYTLFKTINQKIDYNVLLDGKKAFFDIIDKQKLEECNKESDKWKDSPKWTDVLAIELEKYCKNVHMIGNYMPCPDNKYNSVKGFKGKWHYNDRIDLLYSDMIETDPNKKCKNNNKEYIISCEQRREWKKKFEENKGIWFLNEILAKETISTLGKFGCLKKTVFTDSELMELPDYLHTVNDLIYQRNKKINLKCAQDF